MCLVCGCGEPGRDRRAIKLRGDKPEPDEAVLLSVEDALAVAEKWVGWNGGAQFSLGNAWTPHKALRRITDHLVDHLNQIVCRTSGIAPVPDLWRGRSTTLASDWAPFAENELDEATARLRRLGQVIGAELLAHREDWDTDPGGGEWTLRAIATHLAEASATYASRAPITPVAPPPESSANP
jgi:hypothetical protein